eukprot:2401363-Rhodomonas_salina.1
MRFLVFDFAAHAANWKGGALGRQALGVWARELRRGGSGSEVGGHVRDVPVRDRRAPHARPVRPLNGSEAGT